jgi:proline iminopeptidase
VSATFFEVNGTRLFVDDRGEASAPALLYIHGGPGLGCYDFMHCQGDALSRSLRVIGVDQRGVLRSDGLPPGAPLSVDTLIDDFEQLRTQLGIARWAILGHSAGGGYAIDYATRHPDSVTAAVFDCPCWDCDLTDRYRLPVAAQRLMELGRVEEARACTALANKPGRITAEDCSWRVMQPLGDSYQDLFFSSREAALRYDAILDGSGLTAEQRDRGSSHLPLLADMYRPKLGLLATLTQPALLLHGRGDLVTPPSVVERFRQTVEGGRVHTFESSGHFAYLEQATEYTDVVTHFVSSAPGRAARESGPGRRDSRGATAVAS